MSWNKIRAAPCRPAIAKAIAARSAIAPRARFCVAEIGRLGKGEENDLLAGYSADIMVHGQYFDAGNLLDHRFQDWTGILDQMGPHLLQQLPPLIGRKRFDQVLFGRSQNALKADYKEIAKQIGVNLLGAPAHVILLKATNSFTNDGFDFSLGFHSHLKRTPQRGRREEVYTWRRNISHRLFLMIQII